MKNRPSYSEYLREHSCTDTKENWIQWKVDTCGMCLIEAIKAANDPDWGYEPIPIQS